MEVADMPLIDLRMLDARTHVPQPNGNLRTDVLEQRVCVRLAKARPRQLCDDRKVPDHALDKVLEVGHQSIVLVQACQMHRRPQRQGRALHLRHEQLDRDGDNLLADVLRMDLELLDAQFELFVGLPRARVPNDHLPHDRRHELELLAGNAQRPDRDGL